MKQKVKERRKNQRRREGEEKRPLDLIFFFFRFFSCFVPIHFVEKYKERCHRRLLREGARECWRGRCLQQRHRRKSRGEKSRGVVLKLTRLARSVTVLCQGRSTLGDVGIERRVVDVFIALAARALGVQKVVAVILSANEETSARQEVSASCFSSEWLQMGSWIPLSSLSCRVCGSKGAGEGRGLV